MKASDFKPGDAVVYVSFDGREDGVVTSTNDRFVFVRYRGKMHSQATDPADLEKVRDELERLLEETRAMVRAEQLRTGEIVRIEALVKAPVASRPNQRKNRHDAAKDAKKQRSSVHYLLIAERKAGVRLPAPPLVVTFTRIAPRTLDDDNLVGAFKSHRDGVADFLGVDDRRRDLVRYEYRQTKTRDTDLPSGWSGYRVEIEEIRP